MAAVRTAVILFAVLHAAENDDSVNKRADDVDLNTLKSLYENQAARIQILEAEVVALKNSDSQQSADLHAINKRFGTPVAFTAHMSSWGIVTVSTTSPFVYDAVTTNLGNGYNHRTGVFAAPASGLYVFYFSIMGYPSTPTIHAAIMKEGQTLAMTSAEGHNEYDHGSALAAAKVTKGEQVYVQRVDGSTTIEGLWFSSFAGFLVLRDEE